MRVVIDTNVFVSSFQNPEGNPQKIIDLWKRGVFILCISEEIIFEYIEVLSRLGIPEWKIKELTDLFKERENVDLAVNTSSIDVIRDDPQDNRFVECAVAANAQYIISGDKHLKALKRYKNIKILAPLEFLQRLEK